MSKTFYAAERESSDFFSLLLGNDADHNRSAHEGVTPQDQMRGWNEQPEGDVPHLPLPTDRPRPADSTLRSAYCTLDIPPSLSESLQALSRQEGATYHLLLLAAFNALLYRYTGEETIVIGSPGNELIGSESVSGSVDSLLRIRTDLAGDMSFRALLVIVRRAVLDAQRRGAVERQLNQARKHQSPFQVAFSIKDTLIVSSSASGQGMQESKSDAEPIACDLQLELGLRSDTHTVVLRYSVDVFEAGTVARVAANFRVLLEGIVAGPAVPLSKLPLLTDAEKRRLHVDWNDLKEYVPEKTLHQLFEARVEENPKAIAITFDGEQINYGELNARSNRLAHALLRLGLEAGQTVSVMLNNGPRQIEALLGVLKAGGVFVCMDPNYPTKRLGDIFDEVDSHLLVVESACLSLHEPLVEGLESSGCEMLIFDMAGGASEQSAFGGHGRHGGDLFDSLPADNPDIPVSPSDSAYIVYTSGSTGRPKGIVQSHRSFCQFIEWQSREFDIRAPQRFAQWASIAYDASYCEILGTLCFGATLCMANESVRYNPHELITWLRQERVTILQVVPSFCRQVVEVLLAEKRTNDHPLPDLELLLLAGEILPVDLADTWLNKFPDAPKLYNLYGPSETVLATYYEVRQVSPDHRHIPIGKAIDGRQILILDKEQRESPIGARGEIYVRGHYLTMGYFKRPEETAKTFLQNPLHDDYPDPVYRTGDMGRWLSDGTIEFFGRMDNLVKLRGIRVELGDIESVLRRHDSIKNCAVVVRTMRQKKAKLVAKERAARESGNAGGPQILVAYYTAASRVSSPDLRSFVEEHLPAHMVPQQFIQLDELPLNANRKLDLKALPALENVRPELKGPYVAPRNDRERLLADIWQEVLGVDRVGVHDGFFELGGDSLLAMQVLNRTREAVDLKLSIRDLFENQTLADLARLIESSDRALTLPSLTTGQIAERTTYPLSLAQQGVWFLWRLEPDSPFYTAQGSIHFRGSLNLPLLRRAWDALVERHVIFRARFDTEQGRPVQAFDERTVDLPVWDLTHLPAEERRPALEEATRQKAQHALNLEKDPLLQANLFKISDTEHEIALTFHEIILDLWALSIMMRDLAELYQGYLNGDESPLPPLKAQFNDFVVWESENIRREALTSQRSYWESELSGELPILSLPTDRPHPVSPSYRGSASSVMLDPDLSRQLKDLSRSEGATLFMTLLAAFDVLLHVYSGQDDVIVGAPIANRGYENTEDLVGFFLNMLPLRNRLPDDPSFRQLLGRVKTTVTGALTNSEYTFTWMLESVKAARDTSTSPVFQVMFNMLNLPQTSLIYETFDIAFSELDTGYTKYDLALYAQEHGEQIFLQFAYLTDLFDADTIDRMLNNLVVLLKSIVANADSPVSKLDFLHDAERRKLLYEFNETDEPFEDGVSIHGLFERQVEITPDDTAYIHQDERLTYSELNTRANRLAHYLRKCGVEAETRVGICTDRSFDMVVGLLAIMKAGGAYVALDPEFPLPRLLNMLEDTNASVLLVQEGTDRFDNFAGRKISLDADWHVIAQENDSNPVTLTTPENLLNVVYTSSTEGKPKGTLITISAVLNRLFWMWKAYPFRSGDVAVLQKSYALVAATWELFGALLNGIPTVILAREDVLDPARLWDRLVTHRVTHLLAVPGLLEGVLDQAASHPGQRPPLRLATTSAEPVSPAMVARWKKAFPQAPLLNLYGSTECASNVTLYDTSKLPANANRVPVGKPLTNMRVYILDKNLNPLPIGATGEMCVSGVCLARGYLNLPELTASRFIDNPFEQDGSRLYRTGDLARCRPDGTIELLGRGDDQVKIRGFRVELHDIEIALARHANVRKCAVALHDGEGGEALRPRLVGYVVPRKDPAPTISEFQRFLRETLPEYMVPSTFVVMESLPTTPTGKVKRRALPAPDSVRPDLESTFAPARTPIEEALAATWAEALGLERVGIHDNFFELGGHSLLATQVISRIRDTLRVELPLRKLFQLPTIADLASEIADLKQTQTPVTRLPELVPAPETLFEPFPLTDVQQAYWIGRSGAFELGNIATHFYAEIDSNDLDIERFEQAWRQLIDRHEMCRAIVSPDGHQQILEKVPPYEIKVLNLRGQDAHSVESGLAAVRKRMSHQVLNTDEWPLFEIRASRLDDHRTRLHLSFDALMFDASSKRLLFREWFRLYENPEASLRRLELSFRDYVLAELALEETKLYERALRYWLSRIDTLPPAPELPLAKNPGSVTQPRFVGRTARLDPDTWLRLKNRANRAGLTPSGMCLAAFAELLKVWSKSPRFTINLTLFNRLPLHPQVNDLVGDFTSLTLLEVNQSPNDTFETRARGLQEQLWNDLDHRYVGGVRVLRELAKRQSRRPGALMPVVFTSVLTQESSSSGHNPMRWMGETVFSIYQTPQVWLDHSVVEEDGALELIWNALEELFPENMLDDMFESYCAFLHRLADDESSWQETWHETAQKLLPAAQIEQRTSINATEAAETPELLHTMFVKQAFERPREPAVVAADRTLTYEEVYRRANRIGHELRQLGARPNMLVAVVMEKGWEQVVGVLGVLASGAAYLPVDAALPKERQWYLMEHGQAQLVLTQSHLDGALEWPEGIQRLCVDGEAMTGDAGDEGLQPVQSQRDLAYVIYTSGSTGLPKGVMIDHRGAVNTIIDINDRFDVGPEDRVLALSSLSFDLSVWDIFGTLAAGGTIVVPAASGTRDPAYWSTLVQEQGVTIWNSVPALMQLLVEYVTGRSERLPDSLRLVMMSGDWIPVTLPDQIRAISDKDIRIFSLGGATEASIWSIYYPIAAVDPAWPSIPYGKPMINQSFHVLNEVLEPCPVWVPGELYIGGIGLAKGYWRDDKKTGAHFITHPRTGERLYRTGDLGRYLPDGNIEFLGRDDFQVKIQGHRIELGEIETALLQNAGVRAAVVTAVGERHGHKRLVAYVVANESTALSDDDLREFLKQKLPVHMAPSAYVFLDKLPLSSNGKVDRNALPKSDEHKPAEQPGAHMRGVVAQIAQVVASVLGSEQVDQQDDLLYLGADSVDMIRIVNRLEHELGFRPKMDEFYRSPSVSGLAELFEQHLGASGEFRPETKTIPTTQESLLASFDLLRDPAERDAFKRAQPSLRREDDEKPFVELAESRNAMALQEAYAARRSYREFARGPVPFSRFSDFLSCLRQVKVNERPKTLYGSAGGLYPIQTYLYIKPGRVENLSGGIYYYHPVDNRLVLLSRGDVDEAVYDRLVNRPIFEQAAFSIFLICQLGAIAPMYGEWSMHFSTVEAGQMTQLLETTAPACGLGVCQIGSLEFERIRHLFTLDDNQVLVHSLLGGLIDPDKKDWAPFQEAYATASTDEEDWEEGEI